MLKIHLTLFLLLLLFKTQAKTVVTGKIKNAPKLFQATYYEPIDGFCNLVYSPKQIVVNNNSFYIDANITAGFLILNFQNYRVYTFLSNGDSIHLELNYSSSVIKNKEIDSIIISGSNGKGHLLFNKTKHLLLNQKYLINSLFYKKFDDIKSFWDASKNFTDSIIRPFNALLDANYIDSAFYKASVSDIKSSLYWNTINLFEFFQKNKNYFQTNYFKNDTSFLKRMDNDKIFNDKDFVAERLNLYEDLNPLDSNILYSWTGLNYISRFYEDVSQGVLNYKISRDTNFNFFPENERNLSYMHGRILEVKWAHCLYWDAIDNLNEDFIKKSYEMFASYFPKSSFLFYIEQIIEGNLKDKVNRSNYEITDSVIFLNNLKFNSIESFKNFPAKYILIDLWATWCTPCLIELSYKNNLSHFLKEKNIAQLYISINDSSEKNKWEQFINLKKINGYHILASRQLIADIKEKIYKTGEVVIPRYLLIDNNGKVLNTNLPRPSDYDNLKNTINKIVK